METNIPNGASPDIRTDEEKLLDFTYTEVLGSGVPTINWIEKPESEWRKLSIRNQITSSSCGGQAGAKGEEAFTGNVESANPIYRNRSNYPDGGMYMQEIGSILKAKGTCLESESPSQNMTEEQMNAVILPSLTPDVVSAYYTLPAGESLDMDAIATALDEGHAVIILISSNDTEYGSIPVYNGQPTTFGHFVCCVPSNYTLYNGEKALIIDDSCAPHSTINQQGQRIFTESWLKQRSVGFLGLIPASTEQTQTIHYQFNTDLSYGMMNNPDVVALQNILKVEGCMTTSIPSTGNFLSATKAGVIKLQTKYATEILVPAGLLSPTGFCGPATRSFLNIKYK